MWINNDENTFRKRSDVRLGEVDSKVVVLRSSMLGTCFRRFGQREWSVCAVLAVVAVILIVQQIMGGKWQQSDSPLEISADTEIYEVDSGGFISIKPRYRLAFPAKIKLLFSEPSLLTTMDSFVMPAFSLREVFLPLHTDDTVGHVTLTFKTDSHELPNLYKAHVHIKIVHYVWLAYLSLVIGWSYFLSWCITSYPQLYKNWRRRSVVGLSPDFILLNIIGHSSYCAFNASLYYNSYIQREYLATNPNSEIPVQANDLFFSIHATATTVLIIVQCLIYERGDQQLSPWFICIAGGLLFTIFGGLTAAVYSHLSWLRYVYILSFVKVAVTPLKYIPQVVMNHHRRSTEGFAIVGVIFDFVGAFLSLTQACLDSVNSDDWSILLGNPGKLALAMIGMGFNIIFFTQYAVFSRLAPSRSRKDSDKMDSNGHESGAVKYRPIPPKIRDV